ncbi:unnamed protein product [Closterium sp. Naga37s-1]|nr:unnamed protein product [Closterium sp. Naga37s-1]
MIRTAPIQGPRIPFVAAAALASPSLRTCNSLSPTNQGVRVSGWLSAARGTERKRGVSCFSAGRVFSSMAQGQQVAGTADDRVSLGDDASSRIQLYSFATPNGMKVSIALEEMQLPYDAHTVDITKGEQFNPEFIAINPNNKIPAIVDPKGGPGGTPLKIFESGAILLYLAEKSGKFLPQDAVQRWETISWLFFQVGGVGPMFGQVEGVGPILGQVKCLMRDPSWTSGGFEGLSVRCVFPVRPVRPSVPSAALHGGDAAAAGGAGEVCSHPYPLFPPSPQFGMFYKFAREQCEHPFPLQCTFGMFYKFAREQCEHPYPLQRYTEEARRLLGVLEKRLEGREFLVGAGYTIADMATFPWVNSLQLPR